MALSCFGNDLTRLLSKEHAMMPVTTFLLFQNSLRLNVTLPVGEDIQHNFKVSVVLL